MQQAEYNHEDFTQNSQSEADKKLLVKFYYKSVQIKSASDENGRPVFKELEYIDIKVPGQRDGVARPATPRDKDRFPQHYAAFKQRVELPIEGTPLIEWPAISRSLADQFSFANIKTVEQLAELNDSYMHDIKGSSNLKQKAKDWLASTKEDGVLGKLRDELVEKDNTIKELSAQLEDVMNRLEKIEGT